MTSISPSTSALDAGQYTHKEIEKYEGVYGRNFISPGGIATAREFSALLGLKRGQRVLDVGCGIGGGAFYMAQAYGVQVDGLDLSTNMLTIAQTRCAALGLTDAVRLIHADILEFTPPRPYDAIYSRDVFLHIHDKPRLFAQLYACLVPGGSLFFTDYCCAKGEKSQEFANYIQDRQYALCTVAEYSVLLAQAGLIVLRAEDRTEQFIDILAQEASNLAQAPLDEDTKAELRRSWQSKIGRAQRGEQRWGIFLARRPSEGA